MSVPNWDMLENNVLLTPLFYLTALVNFRTTQLLIFFIDEPFTYQRNDELMKFNYNSKMLTMYYVSVIIPEYNIYQCSVPHEDSYKTICDFAVSFISEQYTGYCKPVGHCQNKPVMFAVIFAVNQPQLQLLQLEGRITTHTPGT